MPITYDCQLTDYKDLDRAHCQSEVEKSHQECRLTFSFEYSTYRSNYGFNLFKRESWTDEKRHSLARLPVITIPHDANSTFSKAFGYIPHSLQLNDVRIQLLNEDKLQTGAPTNISSRCDEQPTKTFTTTVELSNWLFQHAINHPHVKLRITGTICGDVSYLASKSHVSNLVMSFDCLLSVPNGLDCVMAWSKEWRNEIDRTTKYENTLEGAIKRAGDDNLCDYSDRPQSVRQVWDREQSRLISDERRQNDMWSLRTKSQRQQVEERYNNLTVEEKKQIEDEYQQTIKVCDDLIGEHDLRVKNRWLDIMTSNSPGIRPVAASVDNQSIKMSAIVKLTRDDVGVPMIASTFASNKVSFVMDAAIDCSAQCSPDRTYDVRDVLKYNYWFNRSSDDPRSGMLRHFGPLVKLVESGITFSLDLSHDSHLITLEVRLAPVGSIKAPNGVEVINYVWIGHLKIYESGYVSASSLSRSGILVTWQKDDVPKELWEIALRALTDGGSERLSDPATSTRIDLWTVPKDVSLEYDARSIVYRRRYSADECSFTEEVSVELPTPSNEYSEFLYSEIQTHPAIAHSVYDKLKIVQNNNQTNVDDRLHRFLANRFPAFQWDLEFFVDLKAKIAVAEPHAATSVGLHGSMLFEGMATNVIDNNVTNGIGFLFDPVAHQLSISQFLTACNLTSVISHIPQLLLERVRLTHCCIRFTEGCLIAYAQTGSLMSDRLVIVQMPLLHLDMSDDDDEDITVLIKIHDSKLINNVNFPELSDMLADTVTHCFVHLDSTQPINVNFDSYHSNFIKEADWPTQKPLTDACLFPTTTVPVGSHLFTVRRRKPYQWTPVTRTEQPADNDNETDQTYKRIKLSHPSAADNESRSKFNIPHALLIDARCSSELAQYVLDFVDMSDVLFSFCALEHSVHNHATLIDGKWWKRRLTREFGANVTRWSDPTLLHWRHERLDPTYYERYSGRESEAVEADVRDRVELQPVWFSAAIHLVQRLVTFAHEVMCLPVGSTRIPSPLLYVLMVSPPFHWTSKYFVPNYAMWTKGDDFDMNHFELDREPHRLFAWHDCDESTSYIGLYSDTSYIENDPGCEHLGRLIQLSKSDGGGPVREVVLDDPDMWPVLLFCSGQDSLRFGAANLHDWCNKDGVYQYCNVLNEMWDAYAAAITCPPQEPIQSESEIATHFYFKRWDGVDLHPELAPSTKKLANVRLHKQMMKQVAKELRARMVCLVTEDELSD